MGKIIKIYGFKTRSFRKGRVPRQLRKFCNNGYTPVFVMTGEISSKIKSSGSDKKYEHEVVVVLNWDGKSAEQKIDDAKLKFDKISAGTDFVPPWSPEFVSLADFGTHIATSRTRYAERMQKLPNSAQKLEASVNVIHDDTKSIRDLVQSKVRVTADVDEKIRICLDAGFDYKQIATRGPRENALKQDSSPGVLIGFGVGPGQHDWELSTDNGVTSMKLGSTTGGVIEISGLVSGKKYWQRNCQVFTKGRHSAWTGWVSCEAP